MAPAPGRPFPSHGEPTPRLAAPPRAIPFSLAVRLLVGSGAAGWLWLTVASPLASIFLVNADLTSWAEFRGDVVSVPGVVLECVDTGASEGGSRGGRRTPVLRTRYRLETDGDAREGISFATGGECAAPGEAVTVEFPAGRPELSRVAGMRHRVFGPELAFALAFPLAGILLVVIPFRRAWRELQLLRHGRLAYGTVLGKEPTNFYSDNRRLWKLRVAFEAERGRHEAVIKTGRPEAVEDDERERILYDPRRPERAAAWDLLRGPPAVDATGNLKPQGRRRGTVVLLLLPVLAVIGHLLAFRFGPR